VPIRILHACNGLPCLEHEALIRISLDILSTFTAFSACHSPHFGSAFDFNGSTASGNTIASGGGIGDGGDGGTGDGGIGDGGTDGSI